jgi:antibiotic biosynthesis monooxygenase (ABM) superfamily enzyme
MKPPARYKMTILIWLTIYPAINMLFLVLGKPLENFPIYIKTLAISLILVPAMVYIFLPLLTNIFKNWLSK